MRLRPNLGRRISVLRVEGLTKNYGSMRAVDAVSFEVAAGEIVGFLGPNGAGKSTTLRMIAGFLSPSAGSVQIGGIDALLHPNKAQRRFGYMPEGVPLYPELRVMEYLRYRAEIKRVKGSTTKAAEAALELAGVMEAQPRIIGHLSKGLRQRVGLADALLGDPEMLILDEPTSGLDPNQIRHVRDLIRSFAGKKTVFLSTHILPEVEATCERVIIVNAGKLVGEGDPRHLRASISGDTVIRLTGRGSSEVFEAALTDLAGIEILESHENGPRCTLRLQCDGVEPEQVFAAVVKAGLTLSELRAEEASLEDVFTDLTMHDAHDLDGDSQNAQQDVDELDDADDEEEEEQS